MSDVDLVNALRGLDEPVPPPEEVKESIWQPLAARLEPDQDLSPQARWGRPTPMRRGWWVAGVAAAAVLLTGIAAGLFFGGQQPVADRASIEGRWQLDSYSNEGQEVNVEENVNTASIPYIEFGDYVRGFAGCNHFGTDGDYEYSFTDGTLTLPESIPIDAGQCTPDALMKVEEFFVPVIWSGVEIDVEIDGDTMIWSVDDSFLSWSRSEQ